jgi:hypothetical protein
MIARREDPNPGDQTTVTDVDGHRFQVCITDLADPTSPTSKSSTEVAAAKAPP